MQPSQLPWESIPTPLVTTKFVDLCTEKNIWRYPIEDNRKPLPSNICDSSLINDSNIFRCTVSAIPATPELAKKCRLPLGFTLHPFRDQRNLHILQTKIVRCRFCRAYINPFVVITRNRWRCNMCNSSNDLPDDFNNDYNNITERPELRNTTVEFIAGSDYMLRPPQVPCYFFILDVSKQATDSRYLHIFCDQLLNCLDQLPGRDEAMIGFVCVDDCLHWFEFDEDESKPRHFVVADVDEPFLPAETGILIRLKLFRKQIRKFLKNLPKLFETNPRSSSNSLGACIQCVLQLVSPIGGRISIFQSSLPDVGIGALQSRKTKKFNVATDFYKRIALECTRTQVAFDIFVLSHDSIDLPSLAELSKITGGSVYHYSKFHALHNAPQKSRFEKQLHRYLTRKIGFEAVLRLRCSQGLTLTSFYGNFFIRSTNLFCLPNVNPDVSYGLQFQVDEDFAEQKMACFQTALLYTSCKGDRRIRVHNMAIPICNEFGPLFEHFDLYASVSLLTKIACDRAISDVSPSVCRESIVSAASDVLDSYNHSIGFRDNVVNAPYIGQLKFFPLFVLGLMKHKVFASTSKSDLSVDERFSLLLFLRNAPTEIIINEVYPALYAISALNYASIETPQPLPLTHWNVNIDGIYLFDTGSYLYLYVCSSASPDLLNALFGVRNFYQIDEEIEVEQLENPLSKRFFTHVKKLQKCRANYFTPIITIRSDSKNRHQLQARLVDDRTDDYESYIEFLHYLRRQIQR